MGTPTEYERTAEVVHYLGYHIVWCSKYRKPVLVDQVAVRLKALLEVKAADRGWTIESIEVAPDHVRIFVRCLPSDSPSFIANQFKGSTSRALRSIFPHLASRLPTLWSKSYFVASTDRVPKAAIRRYVNEQTTKPVKGKP